VAVAHWQEGKSLVFDDSWARGVERDRRSAGGPVHGRDPAAALPPSVLNRAIISHLGLALRAGRQAPSPGMGAALRSGRGADSALRVWHRRPPGRYGGRLPNAGGVRSGLACRLRAGGVSRRTLSL